MIDSKISFPISRSEERLALFFFSAVFCYEFFLFAWICEDAFINFRVIENFFAGDGLVWNKGERVQVFTSPLWMLLTTACTALTGDLFYTTVTLSFVFTILTLVTLFYCTGKNTILFIFVATLLLLARSFVDYSSSGLETPLVAFTLSVFTYLWCHLENNVNKTLVLALAAGICSITRHDTILLTSPFLISQAISSLRPFSLKSICKQIQYLLLGSTPLLVWTIFSLIYYGSPFPNTAYAKIVSNTDQFNVFDQGIDFFKFTQHFDPISLLIIVLSVLISLVYKNRHSIPLTISILLFIAYLFHIGGDYMASRFFIAPVVLSIMIIADIAKLNITTCNYFSIKRNLALMLIFIPSVILGITFLKPENNSLYTKYLVVNGIIDERSKYFESTDFLTISISGLQHPFKQTGEIISKQLDTKKQVVISCHIGMVGYFSGGYARIVDPLSITDPFLSRFPMRPGIQRIGHFERYVPRDYILSILTGSNHFSNPLAHQFYEDVLQATQKPLISIERGKALWRLNTGYYSRRLRELSIFDLGGPILTEGKPEFEMHSCLGGQNTPVYIIGLPEVFSNKIKPLKTMT